MQDFRYVRLFSDARGESHFQDIAVPPDRELSVPPAPPLRMRALGPAVTAALVGGDSGWHGEVAHPAPFRMLQSYLSGTVEVTASAPTTATARPAPARAHPASTAIHLPKRPEPPPGLGLPIA